MDYFEALKASERVSDPQFHAHSPVPPPRGNNVGEIIKYIKATCDDLYFSSESDEPVELFQLSATGLQSMEADLDKLMLPSAHDFAVFVAGERSLEEEGFVCERHPIRHVLWPAAEAPGQRAAEAAGGVVGGDVQEGDEWAGVRRGRITVWAFRQTSRCTW
ncbi:hypothetical protein DL89DRAFT_92080 [Linderina pennispora]|uniref:Uncharacterized protein n=1 Tax=Linderina pennispora TaxID=61395 RepID=A0A1Y1WIL9_9FUNG|nr:uncharacterized protein DL89DRAFT_92080 [Linderina pennispora]ORX73377.1 hypothetical protein DL89DRAFT_92080 [Linderina pennispora]